MRRIESALVMGVLAAGLLGCQLVAALLPEPTGRMPEVGTCAVYELVDANGVEATPDRIEQTRTIIENRINATGVADVVVDADEGGLLWIGIPVLSPDDEAVQEIRTLATAPGVLAFMPVPPELQGLVEDGPLPELMRGREPLFTGEEIESAAPAQDQTTGEYLVSLRFKDTGAGLFDAFAEEHFGEQFAIVFDDEVVSAPVIQATRFGGQAQISGGTGGFRLNELQRLVTVLKFGSLPLEVREVAFGACEAPASAEATSVPTQAGTSGARVIELAATAWLTFDQDGEQVPDIPVVPGESILFRIDNTAGFDHSFWIGTESELVVPNATTEVGIPAWTSGVREVAWRVPEEVDGLMFACTVPGHYYTMRGCFSEARLGADRSVERVGDAGACPAADIDPIADAAMEWQLGGRVEVP
ncbi:MAG: hypothetical protein R6W93_12235 [Candidatus Limnocylindrales bacterium]